MVGSCCERDYKIFFGAMQTQELERIRMLEDRMRRPSKPTQPSEESLKSIKSTDSKKPLPLHKLPEQSQEDSPQDSDIRLSQEEIRNNRKITDFFSFKKTPKVSPTPRQVPESQPIISTVASAAPISSARPHESPEINRGAQDPSQDEARVLRERLRQKDQLLSSFRSQIVESAMKLHQLRRNQLRQRINNNKLRLGQYFTDKRGKQQWMDGNDFKEIREKLENIKNEKEQLEKSKKQARKGKETEENEEWRIALASQAHFLARQEAHCQDNLKRLDEEKSLHIREARLLHEEDQSRYGRSAVDSGNWPKIRSYQLLGLLGRGGFSQVYKGIDTEQLKEVAVKVHQLHSGWNTSTRQSYVKHALRESNVQKGLSHPNIVKLYDTVEIDSSSFCTVLEFCQGPDLAHYLRKHKKLPEKEAKLIIRQVINAIRYLHDLPDKVIHYDLKPQNILFLKGRVKITDFGLCKTTKEEVIELTSQGVGTYWYLPPECFEMDKKAVISPKVDVWSIGVIYYEMIFGEKPFGNQMSQMRILNEGIMLKANSVNFPQTQKGFLSNESKDFIKDCLRFNVQERMDIRQTASHRLFDKK